MTKLALIQPEPGNAERFSALYREYASLVRGVAFRMTGASHEILDDVVQEVFVRVWKALPSFRDQANPKTWIYRIAVNASIDTLRKRKPEAVIVESFEATTQMGQQVANQDLVLKGLGTLSSEHRVVLVLSSMEGLSNEEISQVTKVPIGTVKSRLFHAKKNMMDFLEKNGGLDNGR